MWTEDEDRLLMQLHRTYGNQWRKMAEMMPSRSENAIKNRWHSTVSKRVDVAMPPRAFRRTPLPPISTLPGFDLGESPILKLGVSLALPVGASDGNSKKGESMTA
jgi:hypothetical protein